MTDYFLDISRDFIVQTQKYHKFVENVKIWWKNQFLNQKDFHPQVYTNIIWKSNHSAFQNGRLSLILIMIGSHFMVQNVSKDGQKRQIPNAILGDFEKTTYNPHQYSGL